MCCAMPFLCPRPCPWSPSSCTNKIWRNPTENSNVIPRRRSSRSICCEVIPHLVSMGNGSQKNWWFGARRGEPDDLSNLLSSHRAVSKTNAHMIVPQQQRLLQVCGAPLMCHVNPKQWRRSALWKQTSCLPTLRGSACTKSSGRVRASQNYVSAAQPTTSTASQRGGFSILSLNIVRCLFDFFCEYRHRNSSPGCQIQWSLSYSGSVLS